MYNSMWNAQMQMQMHQICDANVSAEHWGIIELSKQWVTQQVNCGPYWLQSKVIHHNVVSLSQCPWVNQNEYHLAFQYTDVYQRYCKCETLVDKLSDRNSASVVRFLICPGRTLLPKWGTGLCGLKTPFLQPRGHSQDPHFQFSRPYFQPQITVLKKF